MRHTLPDKPSASGACTSPSGFGPDTCTPHWFEIITRQQQQQQEQKRDSHGSCAQCSQSQSRAPTPQTVHPSYPMDGKNSHRCTDADATSGRSHTPSSWESPAATSAPYQATTATATTTTTAHLNTVPTQARQCTRKCDSFPFNGRCAYAARMGHLDCLIRARAEDCPWGHAASEAAAAGHVECMAYVCERRNGTVTPGVYYEALRAPTADCIRYLVERGCARPRHAWEHVVAYGSLATFDFMRTVERPPLTPLLCSIACGHGRRDMLDHLRARGCPWDAGACAAAAREGDLEMLQWLRSHGCPWDSVVCSNAAGQGHAHVLWWAHAHGCAWDERACAEAAGQGYTGLLYNMRNMGCPWDERVTTALARRRDALGYVWARDHGCPCDPAIDTAMQTFMALARPDCMGDGRHVPSPKTLLAAASAPKLSTSLAKAMTDIVVAHAPPDVRASPPPPPSNATPLSSSPSLSTPPPVQTERPPKRATPPTGKGRNKRPPPPTREGPRARRADGKAKKPCLSSPTAPQCHPPRSTGRAPPLPPPPSSSPLLSGVASQPHRNIVIIGDDNDDDGNNESSLPLSFLDLLSQDPSDAVPSVCDLDAELELLGRTIAQSPPTV